MGVTIYPSAYRETSNFQPETFGSERAARANIRNLAGESRLAADETAALGCGRFTQPAN